MSQYINLFNPALQKRRDVLSARALLSAVAVAIFIIILAAGWTRYKVTNLENRVREGEANLKAERERLVSLVKSGVERKSDSKLADELARAEAMLRTRKDLIQLVESGALGRTDGFSEQMRAFARQSMNGLWLTGFSIDGSGGEMQIDGKALNAELLPAYIRRLNGEQIFHGRGFDMLKMHRVEEVSPKPAAGQSGTPASVQPPPHVAFNLSGKGSNTVLAGRQ